MAEARNAVSYRVEKSTNLLFQISNEEVVLRINKNFIPSAFLKVKRTFGYQANRLKNGIHHAVYPVPPLQWGLMVGGPAFVMISKDARLEPASKLLWKFASSIPKVSSLSNHMQISVVSMTVGMGLILVSSFIRRILLRCLFHYQGWLYDDLRKASLKTKIWGMMVKLVSGKHPLHLIHKRSLTFRNQALLPRLPVPSLNQTCKGLLRSVKPLLTEEEYIEMEKVTEAFKKNEGRKLQFFLILKSWISSNYVSDWWEKYVYLRARSSIVINSNYYVLENGLPTSTKQVAKAARLISDILKFKSDLHTENHPPMEIRNMVPLCMSQYERIFSTTRIPEKDIDKLVSFPTSTHIVVLRKGFYYVVELYASKGSPLTPHEIEIQLKWIMHDADQEIAPDAEEKLPSLTAENRATWAAIRRDFFSSGFNYASLSAIESAMFVVSLEHEEIDIDFTKMGRALFHGNGKNVWSDKSFTLVVFPNGKTGLHVEHSWADAPVIAHLWEYSQLLGNENGIYDENGYNVKGSNARQLPPAYKLKWDLSQRAEKAIQVAYDSLLQRINDVDLEVLTFDSYGKGFVKKCSISPDAYIQMAMQIAYKKDAHKFGLTYESSMTRLFKNGRTETVRPCTVESVEFVKAMENPSISKEEKRRLLKIAGDVHQHSYRDTMTGRGFDRHLFALYVVSQGLDIKSKFLESALGMPWKLSTSQQPQQQTNMWGKGPIPPEKFSPGGGFGPVSDDGYGVSYMITGENRIYFHISSKKSSSETDSKRFGENLKEALKEMKEIFE